MVFFQSLNLDKEANYPSSRTAHSLSTRNETNFHNLSTSTNNISVHYFKPNAKYPNNLSLDKVVSSLKDLGLAHIDSNNTWEFPHTKGLISHEICVEIFANILSDKICDLFSDKQKQNINKDFPRLNQLQKKYIIYHDIGKMHPIFKDSIDESHNNKDKNKQIETICTLVAMHQIEVGFNQELLHKLNVFLEKHKQNALNNASSEELKKDTKDFEQHILSLPNNNLFNVLAKCLCPDDIGSEIVVKYLINKSIHNNYSVDIVDNGANLLNQRYDEYIKHETNPISKDAFVYLKLSNYLSDIAYYPNLRLMYFGKNFELNPNFKIFLQRLVNPEYHKVTTSKIDFDLYENFNEMGRPAQPKLWKLGSNLEGISNLCSLGNINALTKAGFDTTNLKYELQSFTQDNKVIGRHSKYTMLEVMQNQNEYLEKKVTEFNENKYNSLMPNLRDFASSNIFNLTQ